MNARSIFSFCTDIEVEVKKTSPKYLLCKTSSGLKSIKNKFSKKEKSKKDSKKKSDKKSIFKKFGEAKTLSDLK